jgi:hypothetical protein
MMIARTILAVVIALSVAILPAASGAALTFKPMDMSPAEMSVSEPMSDCCDHDSAPCHKPKGDCASMAACALKCFNFTGLEFSGIAFPIISNSAMPAVAESTVPLAAAIPPFRPPRV